MRFMVLVQPGNNKDYEAGQMPDQKLLASMGKFNEELAKAGVLLSGEGLQPSSKGAQVRFSGSGKTSVTHGPFTDGHELIGGFWMWQVKSKEEAVEWAKRAPMEDGAVLELRQIFERTDFGPDVEEHERKLPHNNFQTTAPIEASINFVLKKTPCELAIADSQAFYDDEETYDDRTAFEISEIYLKYFKNMANEVSKHLGQAVYQGQLPDALEWATTLDIEPSFDEIFVWKKGENHLYLHFMWEDKDCPIVVSLGAR